MINKHIIPARHGKAFKVSTGDTLKLINTFGTQVVDCWAINSKNLDEYMCMEASRVWLQRLNPIVGDTFVTNKRNPILTLGSWIKSSNLVNKTKEDFSPKRSLGQQEKKAWLAVKE